MKVRHKPKGKRLHLASWLAISLSQGGFPGGHLTTTSSGALAAAANVLKRRAVTEFLLFLLSLTEFIVQAAAQECSLFLLVSRDCDSASLWFDLHQAFQLLQANILPTRAAQLSVNMSRRGRDDGGRRYAVIECKLLQLSDSFALFPIKTVIVWWEHVHANTYTQCVLCPTLSKSKSIS